MEDIEKILFEFDINRYEININNQNDHFVYIQKLVHAFNDELCEGFNRKKIEKFNFLFADDFELNGCAFSTSGNDFICLNKGSVVNLFKTFSKLMQHPDVLSRIDNSGEKYIDKIIEPVFNDERKLFMYDGPKSSIRRDVVAAMSMISIIYIIFHEFGHLYNGHIRWLRDSCGVKKLKITENEFDNNNFLYYYKALEMDADAFAACRTADIIASYIDDPKRSPELYFFDSFKDNYDLFTILHISVYIFYLTMSPVECIGSMIDKTHYLPTKIRCAQVFDIIKEYLSNNRKVEIDNRLVDDELKIIHSQFVRLFRINISRQEYSELRSDKVKRSIERTNQCWVEIRDELQKHAFYQLYSSPNK